MLSQASGVITGFWCYHSLLVLSQASGVNHCRFLVFSNVSGVNYHRFLVLSQANHGHSHKNP